MVQKSLLLVSVVMFMGTNAFALEPVGADGSVFGIKPGLYSGSGQLLSQAMLIPDLDFVSIRQIGRGVIKARTKATFFGTTLAKAAAELKVVSNPDGQTFRLIDLNTQQVSGSGACSDSECTFTANVMNGQLQLTETWQPKHDGFKVINGSQNFKSLPAVYEGSFSRTR